MQRLPFETNVVDEKECKKSDSTRKHLFFKFGLRNVALAIAATRDCINSVARLTRVQQLCSFRYGIQQARTFLPAWFDIGALTWPLFYPVLDYRLAFRKINHRFQLRR